MDFQQCSRLRKLLHLKENENSPCLHKTLNKTSNSNFSLQAIQGC